MAAVFAFASEYLRDEGREVAVEVLAYLAVKVSVFPAAGERRM